MTTYNTLPPAAGARRPLLLLLALAVAGMFVTSFVFRLNHPWTVQQAPQSAQAPSRDANAANAAITALMQRLQANPDDPAILLDLARHFTHTEDWARTEHFARRLTVVNPGSFDGHYLLGMAEHGLGRHQESAASLERALNITDDPALRYSLGVLYAYYLDNKSAAVAQLRAALAAPDLAPALKADLEQELKKLNP